MSSWVIEFVLRSYLMIPQDISGMEVSPAGLQEFGLSSYEAQAYITLIMKGTISASEVSYHSKVPRPKVYPVLRRLEERRLVVLSGKPVMCTAVRPEEAFGGIIQEHAKRVEAMNGLVDQLKRAGDESRRAGGADERRYAHVEQGAVLAHLQAAIEGAKESVYIMAGSKLAPMLAECRQQLVLALRRNADLRLVMPASLVGSQHIREMPDGIRVRIGGIAQDVLITDGTTVIVPDNHNGGAAVMSGSEILGRMQAELFVQIWEAAQNTDGLADMTGTEADEAYKMIRLVDGGALGHLLGAAISKKSHDITGYLEQNGIKIRAKSWEQLVDMIDTILQMTCGGHVDANGNHITVESNLNSGHSLPWASILDEYLHGTGKKTSVVYQNRAKRGERVHIRIRR